MLTDLSDPGLLLNDDLRVPGDAGTKWSREGQGLVKGVGVEGLGASKHSGHRLNTCPQYVVVRVLHLHIVKAGSQYDAGRCVASRHVNFRTSGKTLS